MDHLRVWLPIWPRVPAMPPAGHLNMPILSARTRIAELAAGPPEWLATLAATGLYRPGDDQEATLGELCWSHGFNAGILLQILASARSVLPAVPELAGADRFRNMALDELVGHIVTAHHDGLRRHLPRLVALADELAALSAPGDETGQLRDQLHALALELDAHLAHEEEALFPMVRDLAIGALVAPTRCGGAVAGPIACMENEHAATARTLVRLGRLTEASGAPGTGDALWLELCDGLRWLDRDLREHIYKEDHILFPRALAAQRGPRVSPRGAAAPLS